jgi:hypothetical protein
LIYINDLALLKGNDNRDLRESFPEMTTTILTLGIDKDDLKHLDIDDNKILFKAKRLTEFESALDTGEEIDNNLLTSLLLTCPKSELRTILGLTRITTRIVLHDLLDVELDLDSLRQLGIGLLQAPLTSDGCQALAESH